jgi:hypothetical protein
MRGFSFRKLFSPTPRTFIKSSIFLNDPFFCRYSRMRSAVDLPMPGNVSSCATLAVFRLIGADADADADAGGLEDVFREDSCSALVVTPSPNANRTAITMRIMSSLLSASGRRSHA